MARKSRKNIDAAVSVQPTQKIYSAAAYIRLSSDVKRKPGDSLETQQDIIENFIALAPDIQLEEVYKDNHKTGTNFERPAFQRMLSDIESGRINCIIVKDLSRFGRNAIDAGYYIEKLLPSLGIRFIAVTDDFDSLEGDGGIMLPLKNLIAEAYALDISRKCKAVQRQNIKDGRFVGRLAPYGYEKAPDDCRRLIVDEEAAVNVRQMYEWAARGFSIGDIVRTLNDMKLIPPSHYKWEKGLSTSESQLGKPYWQKRTVINVLTDQVYVGDMVQGKSITVNNKKIVVDRSEWICVPDTHEPIISRDLFARVQMKLKNASEKGSCATTAPYTPNIFPSKVVCAHCGYLMKRKRQNKDDTYWYRCESQYKYHKNACYQVSIKEADLKSEIFELLRRHAEAILGGYLQMERALPVKKAVADTELADINRRLAANGNYLNSLYENMQSGLLTVDEYTTMKADYKKKIQTMSERADEIRSQRREAVSVCETYYNFAEAASDALTNKELTADIVERLVEKIMVRFDKSFEVVLRFRDEFREVRLVG